MHSKTSILFKYFSIYWARSPVLFHFSGFTFLLLGTYTGGQIGICFFIPKVRDWNTCFEACSYLDATHLLTRLANNGLISSKSSGMYFKSIPSSPNIYFTLKQTMYRGNKFFTCLTIVSNICWLQVTLLQGSEIEKPSKTSPTESLVHDFSLGRHISDIHLFFNWWLIACQLFGRAHCRVMPGCGYCYHW